MKNNQDYYKTVDLALVTAISLFVPIEDVNKQNPRRAEFIFQRTKELEKLIDKYWKKELLVEPRDFFDQLKALKARIYETG